MPCTSFTWLQSNQYVLPLNDSKKKIKNRKKNKKEHKGELPIAYIFHDTTCTMAGRSVRRALVGSQCTDSDWQQNLTYFPSTKADPVEWNPFLRWVLQFTAVVRISTPSSADFDPRWPPYQQ